LAEGILGLVLRYRRAAGSESGVHSASCPACMSPHVGRVLSAIERGQPVSFVLPAFPGKSPNPGKVLGPRPDMAERQSLAFLDALCRRIQQLYAPGARIVLCSDGRVFNDVVGIQESDITTYQQDIADLIAELGAKNLSLFNLDDVSGAGSFDAMRARLLFDFGEPLETLQAAVRAGGDTQRLYLGITRFLLEDALRPGMTISKTALQRECKQRAYQVIQRSRAWDGFIARYFPDAVRLSIHPQDCGGRKIGIHLLETADAWLTPWHCVAAEIGGRFALMKRAHAEALAAELVYRDGRPSHYVLAEHPGRSPGHEL
jgi:pyoverdine/dityrosine biosynthesis protein Dit1